MCAYVVALRLELFTFQGAGTRIRLDAGPQPDAGPERSAEITDTLMALVVAVIFALLPAERDPGSASIAPRFRARERRLRDWQREQARGLVTGG
jgi:hypothetical protein